MSDEPCRKELNVYVLPLNDGDEAGVTESRRKAITLGGGPAGHVYQICCEGYQMLRIRVPVDKAVVFGGTPVTGGGNPALKLMSPPE